MGSHPKQDEERAKVQLLHLSKLSELIYSVVSHYRNNGKF
jgi:hypothetical protein